MSPLVPWVTATTTLFPRANSSLHLKHCHTSHLEISLSMTLNCAVVSPVLLTRANTLDRSRHFEPRTFLNRRCCCCCWELADDVIWIQSTWASSMTSLFNAFKPYACCRLLPCTCQKSPLPPRLSDSVNFSWWMALSPLTTLTPSALQ